MIVAWFRQWQTWRACRKRERAAANARALDPVWPRPPQRHEPIAETNDTTRVRITIAAGRGFDDDCGP